VRTRLFTLARLLVRLLARAGAGIAGPHLPVLFVDGGTARVGIQSPGIKHQESTKQGVENSKDGQPEG